MPGALTKWSAASLPGQLVILHSGEEFKMSFQTAPGTCGFVGAYSQTGSIGAASGTFSCNKGTAGTFTMAGMQWTIFGMTAQIAFHPSNACRTDSPRSDTTELRHRRREDLRCNLCFGCKSGQLVAGYSR